MSFDGNAVFFQKKREGYGEEREGLGNFRTFPSVLRSFGNECEAKFEHNLTRVYFRGVYGGKEKTGNS